MVDKAASVDWEGIDGIGYGQSNSHGNVPRYWHPEKRSQNVSHCAKVEEKNFELKVLWHFPPVDHDKLDQPIVVPSFQSRGALQSHRHFHLLLYFEAKEAQLRKLDHTGAHVVVLEPKIHVHDAKDDVVLRLQCWHLPLHHPASRALESQGLLAHSCWPKCCCESHPHRFAISLLEWVENKDRQIQPWLISLMCHSAHVTWSSESFTTFHNLESANHTT